MLSVDPRYKPPECSFPELATKDDKISADSDDLSWTPYYPYCGSIRMAARGTVHESAGCPWVSEDRIDRYRLEKVRFSQASRGS